MRIALLNPVFWPEVRRGSERFIADLSGGLIERGHTVRLLTSHRGLPSRQTEDGLDVVRSWRPPDGRLRRRLFEDHLTHLPFSFRELMRGDDEIAHALYPTDTLAAVAWKGRTGRPVVLSYMGIPHRRSLANRRLRIEVMRRALAGADAVVALSAAAADGFRHWLGVEPMVIPPGVDLETFTSGGERSPTPTVFCPAHGDEPRKRVDLLRQAMALVQKELPEARLELAGPTDDTSTLVAAYRHAWVTCLPSLGEAFGLVLAESLACGTPVVGTDDGGIPEVLGGEKRAGRLFSGGAEDLAAALLEVLALAGDKKAPAACRRRAEHFPIARTVDAYEGLYRDLLERA